MNTFSRGRKNVTPTGSPTVSAAGAVASQVLDDAVRGAGLSNQVVGDACSLTEKTIREARDPGADSRLATHRVLLLPRSVFDLWHRGLRVGYEKLHGTLTPGCAIAQAHQLVDTSLEALRVIHGAVADGKIDKTERVALLGAIAKVERACGKLRESLGEDDDATTSRGVH